MSWGGCFSRWVLNKSILEQISFHEFPEASSEVICWSTVLSFFLSKGFQEEIISGLFLVLRIELCRCQWPYLSSLLVERQAANIVTAFMLAFWVTILICLGCSQFEHLKSHILGNTWVLGKPYSWLPYLPYFSYRHFFTCKSS